MTFFRTALSITLPIALALSAPLLAQAQATVKPDGQFRAVFGLGASLSSGNTDASNLSFAADAVRATATDKTSLYGSAQYARTEGLTTAEKLRLGGRQDHDLTPAWFVFGGLDLERNPLNNLKLRGQASGGLGWHAIKSDTTTFDLFAGLGYTHDSYETAMLIDGQTRSTYGYAGLLLGQESTHKLSASTSAKQRLTLAPNLKNRGEWRANWDAGLSVAMSNAMSLTVGLGLAYNSEPGPGRKTTDTLFTTGISVRFE